jgi:integrase
LGRSLFREVSAEFLAQYQSRKPRDRTMTFQIRVLDAAFGGVPFHQVGEREIGAFFARRVAAGISGATCNRQLSALNGLFKWAVRLKLLPENPIAQMPRYAEEPEEARTITPAQAEALILAASPHAKAYLIALAYSGGRKSETIELTWDRFDFEKNTFAFVRETVKGKKRTRVLPMPPLLRETMLAIRPLRVEPGARVFLYNGRPVKSMRRALLTAARRAGLGHIGHHTIRHSFGQWFIERDGPLVLLQRILGHSTIGMTMRYVHTSPGYTASGLKFMGPGAEKRHDDDVGEGEA